MSENLASILFPILLQQTGSDQPLGTTAPSNSNVDETQSTNVQLLQGADLYADSYFGIEP